MVDSKHPVEVLLLFCLYYKLCVYVGSSGICVHMQVPTEVRRGLKIL